MNVGILTDVLPNLFFRRRVSHALDDLLCICTDYWTHANSAALTTANVSEVFTLEHSGVP